MQHSFFTPTRFIPEPTDFERWSKQRKQLFDLLKDKRIHRREELVRATNAHDTEVRFITNSSTCRTSQQ